jgi:hypothetical protein
LLFENVYKLIYDQLVTELLRYAGKLIICDDKGDTFAVGCAASIFDENQFEQLSPWVKKLGRAQFFSLFS